MASELIDGIRWQVVRREGPAEAPTRVVAVADDDGVVVLADWHRRSDGDWRVYGTDTEGAHTVFVFGDHEPIPPTPPGEAPNGE